MVAGADVLIHAVALLDDALAIPDCLGDLRLQPTLLVQHAFRGCHDHFRAVRPGGQRLLEHVAHASDVICAIDLPNPRGADPFHGTDDGVVGLAVLVLSAGGRDVLPAGRRRIEVVDDQEHSVVFVEDGVADAAGQAVVPEAAVAHDGDRPFVRLHVESRGGGRAEAEAHGRRPDVEGRQDGEQVTSDVSRHMVLAELLLDHLHRGEDRTLGTAGAQARRPRRDHLLELCDGGVRENGTRGRHGRPVAEQPRLVLLEEGLQAGKQHLGCVVAAHGQHFLTRQLRVDVAPAQDRIDGLLDILGLAFLDDQHRLLARAEVDHFGVDHGIGDVEHVKGYLRVTVGVREAEVLESPDDVVVHPTLQDDADRPCIRPHPLVHTVLTDEVDRCRHALRDLLLLVQVGSRRQHDAVDVPLRAVEGVLEREGGLDVVLARERAMHVAGPDAHLQHHGRVRDLGQAKAFLDQVDDAGVVRPRVEEPHLGLHREGVSALLHDGGALAVVLADDDHGTARHATGREVRQRVGGDVGPDRRLPGDCAAQGIHDRSRQHRGRGRLAGRGLVDDAQLVEHVLRIREHVHEVRDGRALVASDIRHAGLKQRFRDRQDALAPERVAIPEPQVLDLTRERSFSHCAFPRERDNRIISDLKYVNRPTVAVWIAIRNVADAGAATIRGATPFEHA